MGKVDNEILVELKKLNAILLKYTQEMIKRNRCDV